MRATGPAGCPLTRCFVRTVRRQRKVGPPSRAIGARILAAKGGPFQDPRRLARLSPWTVSRSLATLAILRRNPSKLEWLGEDRGDNAKWGFAVYRTTYGDDVGWERVKRVIQETAIAPLRENGEHGLIDSLDYVLMDDRDKFDGMSRPALREHFKAWAPAAFVRDGNPHYAHVADVPNKDSPERETVKAIRRYPTFQVDSRYTYLIEIDEESLRSIADARLTREWGGPAGHFNFVDSRWKLEGPEVYTSEAERITAELDRRLMQPIDGCTDEDVGWMKVTVRRLGFEFQMMANTYLFDSWYPYYRRPPLVVDDPGTR